MKSLITQALASAKINDVDIPAKGYVIADCVDYDDEVVWNWHFADNLKSAIKKAEDYFYFMYDKKHIFLFTVFIFGADRKILWTHNSEMKPRRLAQLKCVIVTLYQRFCLIPLRLRYWWKERTI